MKPELGKFRFELRSPTAHSPVDALAEQLRRLPMAALPLQAGCVHGGWVDTNNARLTLLGAETNDDGLEVTIMAYFEEVVGGCNCSDDPVHHPAMLRMQVSVAVDGCITSLEAKSD